MNNLHRHISPPRESKDSSLKIVLFLTVICLLLIVNASFVGDPNPTLEQSMVVSDEQKLKFIGDLRRQIAKVNRKIKFQQALVDKLNQRLANQSFHSNSDLRKLRRLYKEYGINSKITANDFDSELEQLRERMMPVLPSVVIAMAALESSWGQSRSALQYKNYFLKTCLTSSCRPTSNNNQQLAAQSSNRIVPQMFNEFPESTKALINSINSHDNFQVFRNSRAGFQRRGQLYTGKQIIGSLKYASIYSDTELQILENILLENSL